jgi:hypothetical protein
MKTLHIEPTLNSPEVNFDTDSREFVISGQSIITDVQAFYTPIIEWLEKYANESPDSLVFKFSLNYYNLASAKRFMFIIYLLSKMRSKGCLVKIEWRFFKDDEFMREFGEDLSDHFDVPLTMVPSRAYVPGVSLAS